MSNRLSEIIVGRAPALGQRLFRRYYYGHACSVLARYIQAVALSWLVYRITGSPALLGAAVFLTQAPQLVVAPLAGVLIDRFDRRHILIGLQLLFATQAAILTILVTFDWIQVWHIMVISLMLGLLSSFDLPSRQSLLLYLLDDKKTLGNAVALNSTIVHTGRLIGPPIAGVLLTVSTEAVCFLLSAISYLIPISAILSIRTNIPRQKNLKTASALKEVARYFKETFEPKVAIGTVALVNITASAYVVLMPVFVTEVFGGTAQSLGILLGMGGAGALVAAVYLSTRSTAVLPTRVSYYGCLYAFVGLVGFTAAGYMASTWAALPMVALMGFGISLTNIGANTRLQHLAPDSLRGRVISIFGSIRFGMDAFGGLIAGTIAAQFHVLPVFVLLSVVLAAGCVAFWVKLRRAGLLLPD